MHVELICRRRELLLRPPTALPRVRAGHSGAEHLSDVREAEHVTGVVRQEVALRGETWRTCKQGTTGGLRVWSMWMHISTYAYDDSVP